MMVVLRESMSPRWTHGQQRARPSRTQVSSAAARAQTSGLAEFLGGGNTPTTLKSLGPASIYALVRKLLQKKRRGQRGAVLVEAALVLPSVLTLLLGLVEFGFIWKDELTISNATRSAARVGSADGKNAASDYDMLQQIKSSVGALPGGTATIQRVIVWKANTSSSVPTECLNATWPVGVS